MRTVLTVTVLFLSFNLLAARAVAGRLQFGGEWRLRFEAADQPEFGLGPPRDRAALNRLLLNTDLALDDHVRIHVELGSFLASRSPAAAPTDVSRLDLAQAFVELSGTLGSSRISLRAGRQEIALGSSRLVSVRESPNIRRAFDGLRLGAQTGRFRIDALWLRPVALSPGVFDDRTDQNEQLRGLYAQLKLPGGPDDSLDVYWLVYDRRAARFAGGVGREQRHSLGLRLHGDARGFDWDVEPVLQMGRFGTGRLQAWTLASDFGFRPAGVALAPRFGLKADIASGDGNPQDDVLRTFNALYPRLPYFTEAGLAVPANIMDLHPSVSLVPHHGLVMTLGANFLWRHRRTDAVYVPPLLPALPPTPGSRFVGVQWEVNAVWKTARGLEYKAYFVQFDAGPGNRAAGGRSGRFLAGSVAYRF